MNRTEAQKVFFSLRLSVLVILLTTQIGCSRVTEFTHSITNTFSGNSSNKSSAPSMTVTTSYRDEEGDFNASLLESIKPKATTKDWMFKHFGDAATTTKIENDMALLSWPFIVEIKKSKKSYVIFKSKDSIKKPMFLHVAVDQKRVQAVWVNDRPEPNEEEALKALEHPKRLVTSEFISVGNNKTAAAPAKLINPVVIPESPVIIESEKPIESAAATTLPETAATPNSPSAPASSEAAPNQQTPPASTEKPSSDETKLETKEPVPAKSEDEKMEADMSKEIGNLKSK